MASSRVEVPDIISERVRQWNPFDRGRVDGVIALLSNDDWRRAHQVDMALNEADLEEFFEDKVVFVGEEAFIVSELVIDEGLLWDVTHSGVRVMFTKGDLFVQGDRILIEGYDDGAIFVLAIENVSL